MITKETYAWIEELLNPEITEISDDNYYRLVREYFKKDKTDWYKEDDNNYKNWDSSKVIQFWNLIRKFFMPRGKEKKMYDFRYFYFPEIISPSGFEGFFKEFKERVFSEKIDFSGATFLDIFSFSKTIFKQEVKFKRVTFNDLYIVNAKFEKNVIFDYCEYQSININNSSFNEDSYFRHNIFNNESNFNNNTFNGLTWFNDSNFQSKAYFSRVIFLNNRTIFNEVEFHDDVEFDECVFHKEVQFMPTTFSKSVEFIRSEFHDKTSFNQSQFKGITIFDKPIFKEKTDFSYCYFEDINFKEINTHWPYRDYNYTEPPKLYFKDVFFNSKTFIKNTDLTKLELDNSDVTNITFSRCIWDDQQNRLKLINELPIRNIETKNQLKLSDENSSKKTSIENLIKKLRDSENHYRQLKKNFDSAKSWELSGKAYVSEMEMRKRRLYLEGKNYQWFIYKFYDVFSGYTQDFRKPMVSLVGLILLFSGLYFFIDYDFVKALQRGIKGALPYMQINTETKFEGYWLILRNIELVLGGTFLAFFVLALRKRFKQ